MAVYDTFKKTALKGITKYGAEAYIVRDSVAYPVRALLENYTAREIDGELVLRTDQKVTVPSLGLAITPLKTDVFKIKKTGALYKIIEPRPLQPGGEAVFYEFQARAY